MAFSRSENKESHRPNCKGSTSVNPTLLEIVQMGQTGHKLPPRRCWTSRGRCVSVGGGVTHQGRGLVTHPMASRAARRRRSGPPTHRTGPAANERTSFPVVPAYPQDCHLL